MLYNRTPTQDGNSTFEKLRGKNPDLRSVRVLRCLTYNCMPYSLRKNFQDKAIRKDLLGTTPEKQHKVLNLDNGDIYYVKHAQFNEIFFSKNEIKFDTYKFTRDLAANEGSDVIDDDSSTFGEDDEENTMTPPTRISTTIKIKKDSDGYGD